MCQKWADRWVLKQSGGRPPFPAHMRASLVSRSPISCRSEMIARARSCNMPIAGLPLERTINLHQLLETGLLTKPHELALVSFESKWTWRELDQASRRLGAHYLGLG